MESITDSQTWTYNDRGRVRVHHFLLPRIRSIPSLTLFFLIEAIKIDQDYTQRYQQPTSTYDNAPISTAYGLSPSPYSDVSWRHCVKFQLFRCCFLLKERDFASTLPRSVGLHSPTVAFSPEKPQKSKSFMSSLKHLTLPRRKHHGKAKTNDDSMSSQASSTSQLNVSVPTPSTNLAAHSLSSGESHDESSLPFDHCFHSQLWSLLTALPGPHPGMFRCMLWLNFCTGKHAHGDRIRNSSYSFSPVDLLVRDNELRWLV